MANVKNKKLPYIKLFGILIPMIGIISSLFFKSNTIYKGLTLPLFSPPVFVFVIAWTILYIILGFYIANAFYYKEKKIIGLFWVHFICNLAWGFIFFNMQMYFVAYIALMVIYFTAVLLIYITKRAYRLLLIPYLIWLTFAAYLNFMIVILNP